MTDLNAKINQALDQWSSFPGTVGDHYFYRLLDMRTGKTAPDIAVKDLSAINKWFDDIKPYTPLEVRKDVLSRNIKTRLDYIQEVSKQIETTTNATSLSSTRMLMKSLDVSFKFTNLVLRQALDSVQTVTNIEDIIKLEAKVLYFYETFTELWGDMANEIRH